MIRNSWVLFCVLAMPLLGHAQTSPASAELAVDHVKLIKSLDAAAMKRGEALYSSMCVACHGTPERPGTLPTILRV